MASCWKCVPDAAIADDFGDCINMENLQLEASTRRNLELAATARRRDYNFTELLAHAQQVVKLDDESDSGRVLSVITAINAVPVKPLTPWMPHSTAEELVVTRELLQMHTSPMELRLRDVSVLAIINSSVTIDHLLKWNYTLGELRDIGFTLDTLVTLGFRAAHLKDRAIVSVHVLRTAYACTFESIIQIERKFCKEYGALLSYLCAGLDLEGHQVLGLRDLNALRPHKLDRLAVLVLAKSVKLAGLVALGFDAEMVREFDLLSADDVRELTGLSDLGAAAAALKIDVDEVRVSEIPKPIPQNPQQLAIQHVPQSPPAQYARPAYHAPVAVRPHGFHGPPPQPVHDWRPLPQRPPQPQPQPHSYHPPQPRGYPGPPAYQPPYQSRVTMRPHGAYTGPQMDAMLAVAMQNE